MTQEKAIQVIAYHQRWRKGADIPQTDVSELTDALDLLPTLIHGKDREIVELKSEIAKLKTKVEHYERSKKINP